MKKVLIIVAPSFLLAVGIFLILHYFIGLGNQKGALQVTSSPDSQVFLNNSYLGQTPMCKCDSGDMIAAGEYTIRLVPLDKSLSEFDDKVTISQGVLTVVDRKFGKDSLSEGSIISLTPLSDKNDSQLLVVSFPQGASVLLDDNPIGKAPLLYPHPTESDHVITVQKSGYNDKTVRIRTPLGYKLTIAIYLSTISLIPPNVTLSSVSPAINMVTGTPTPAGIGAVIILQTPTGFLRVHPYPILDDNVIAQVKPGQSFPLISIQPGWFSIEYAPGEDGWVSSQYAKRQ